jgi:5-methylcytosine-specific restriction endonuclease McrA
MDHPTTRAEAKATGAKYYFTGKLCTRGHVALRKTKGSCVECMKEDWAIDNAKRAQQPKSEAAKEAARRYYAKNRDMVIARASARTQEAKRSYKQTYKAKHPDLYKSLNSVRRRRHRNATPPWVTAEQKLAMRQLYLQAQNLTAVTKERYVVDHIVPLISDVVCGLHVPWNLRVITQEENLQKSNKLVDAPAI